MHLKLKKLSLHSVLRFNQAKLTTVSNVFFVKVHYKCSKVNLVLSLRRFLCRLNIKSTRSTGRLFHTVAGFKS